MASSCSKATALAILADYNNINGNLANICKDINVRIILETLLKDINTLLTAVNTDGAYSVAVNQPRCTIVPFSLTRPYKVKAGQAISYSVAISGGEATATPVYSAVNLPVWMTLNSGSGAFGGTAPAVSSTKHNIISGGKTSNLYDDYPIAMVSVKTSYGESTNGPVPYQFRVVGSGTPDVSSAATAAGNGTTHVFTTYNIAASNSPTSFVAYGLEQLPGLSLNSSTGAISGTLNASVQAGTYTIYIAGVNAAGEGPDKAVVVTIS